MSEPLPSFMNCIEIEEPGGPEVLKPATRPLPRAEAGEVLVRVAAAGINRPDVMQRQGMYQPPSGVSDLPGLEIAGTVTALGDGVDGWQVGDTLCGLVAGGGYAEFCTAPAPQCLPVPNGLDMVEAASLPETVFTVWTNVFDRAGLEPGETLLVHGGTSGIGTTAIQMANQLGSPVIATAGSDEKCAACDALGAARTINYRDEDFVEAVDDFTDGKGVDVILDMVGGDYVSRDIKALAHGGPARLYCFPGRAPCRNRPRPDPLQALDPDRLHPAATIGRGQGRHRSRRQGDHLALDRSRGDQGPPSIRPFRWPRPPRRTV